MTSGLMFVNRWSSGKQVPAQEEACDGREEGLAGWTRRSPGLQHQHDGEGSLGVLLLWLSFAPPSFLLLLLLVLGSLAPGLCE